MVGLLAGCGDDAGGGGSNDAGTGSDSGGGIGDSMGGTLLISGTSCDGSFSFQLGGDERLVFGRNTGDSNIKSFFILDGPLFDTEDEAAWQTYAQSYDVLLAIGISPNVPLAVGTITNIFDPLFAARGVGIVGFDESGGSPIVEITAIDTTAMTASITFTLPVAGSSSLYPPVFASYADCVVAGHTATGSYTGTYQVMDF